MNFRNVALISGHVSPLRTTTGLNQANLIANLSLALTKLGHNVDIFTRWSDPSQQQVVEWRPGIRLIHVKAGPVSSLPATSLLPFTDEFATGMLDFFERQDKVYNLTHATFWISAMVAAHLKSTANLPYVVTFHEMADASVKQADSLVLERSAIERHTARHADHIGVSHLKDKQRLIKEYRIDPARISTVPAGHNVSQSSAPDAQCQRMATITSRMYDQALAITPPTSNPSFGMQALNASQA